MRFLIWLVVSLLAPAAMAAGGTCTGTYTATAQRSQCANGISLSGSILMTGLVSADSGTLQGSVSLGDFVYTEGFLPNGNCAAKPGSFAGLSLALSGTLSASGGTLNMAAVNGAQLSGTFTQTAGQLSGAFGGAVWGPNIQGSFNCVLRDGIAPGPFLLTVTRAGGGAGSVVSAPGGIDCGQSCSASFPGASIVSLAAVAAPGSYFKGWSGECSGRTTCRVTMDAAKGVTATFVVNPFAVSTTGTVTETNVSLKTIISFKETYLGKRGAVFVTARIPKAAIPNLLQSAGDDSMPPHATAAPDTSSTVLVQQTSSGWQVVVNGQLVPYTTGVLGEELSAQTILYTTESSSLAGAQFCVGYGTNASDMVASGNMVPVGEVPDSGSTDSTSESCVIEGSGSAAVMPLTGLWWNPAESGWGMSVTQQGTTIFVAWYTYDAAGKPLWYVMSSCPVAAGTCSGDIYSVSGGTPLTVPWNGAGKVVAKAGSGQLVFADDDNAVFSYTLNGVAATKNVTRQIFATGTAQPSVDYSSLWWNPAESGWGVSITQQYTALFVALYTYDAGGAPYWYVASSCPLVGSGCTGDLYKVTGGSAPTVAWNGADKVVSKVGSVSLVFSDGTSAALTYTIDGVSAARAITRQQF